MGIHDSSQVALLFDLGNTRLKWRLVCIKDSSVVVLAHGQSVWSEDFDGLVSSILPAAECSKPEYIWVASVVGAEREQRLVTWCQVHLGIVAQFARSGAALAGLTNGYSVPERLGVDRWLALLAVKCKTNQPCLVVDAGSAVTVDLLAEHGRHLGGYIAPGLGLMRASLFGGTDAVRVREDQVLVSVAPGHNTDSAVAGALASMLLGLLQSAKEQLGSQLSPAVRDKMQLILTGGDAKVVAGLLSAPGVVSPVEYSLVPDLVFDGLICWGRSVAR